MSVEINKHLEGNFSADKIDARKLPVGIKKLETFKGELPAYASPGSSGFDIRAQLKETLDLSPGERALVPTGLSFSIPVGFELQARPRSGWAYKQGLSVLNTPGTIDADYRGEVKIIVINLGQENIQIHDQERVAQLVLCPVFIADFQVTDDLDATQRGAGGFGSSGKV
jgi:dUTP pyrophosphatase